MDTKTFYFDKVGEANTDTVLDAVKKRATELGIKTIVVASSRGTTGVKALDAFEGLNVVVVGHEWGHIEPNATDFLDENRRIIESRGGKIVAGIHTFGGLQQAFRPRPAAPVGGAPPAAGQSGPPPGGMAPPALVPGDIIARTLGLFGRGMKVAVEITIMAADAGQVRTDEDVIAVAGSSRGADTAIVIKPANAARFFELRIREVICKPRV